MGKLRYQETKSIGHSQEIASESWSLSCRDNTKPVRSLGDRQRSLPGSELDCGLPLHDGESPKQSSWCAELGMALEEVMTLFWKLMSTHQAPGHENFLCQMTVVDLQTQYMTEGDMWRSSEACFLRVPFTSSPSWLPHLLCRKREETETPRRAIACHTSRRRS